MLILEDTRQQNQKHNAKHDYFRSVGVSWNRTALYCGDYTLPTDQSVCIDTKKDIYELVGDIQVKQMSKTDIKAEVVAVAEQGIISAELADKIFHAVCDDDADRYAEKEINDLCFQNNVPEGQISAFQALYVKRHGFFHRGLKRAQNSGVKLYVLVENEDGVESINDLFYWRNKRLDLWRTTNEVIGYYRTGRPKYKRVQKYPNAMNGQQLAKACLTMQTKYGVTFLFCKPEEAGKKILELLGKGGE